MLLQTNSYIVPKDKRAEHARLMRRFRQVLGKLGCDMFEIYEQVGANWGTGDTNGRYVQIMRFRDRKHQLAVQNAERSDPVAQALINEFCQLVNFQYQQQQGFFAVGFYNSVLPVAPMRGAAAPADNEAEGDVPAIGEAPADAAETAVAEQAGHPDEYAEAASHAGPVDETHHSEVAETDEAQHVDAHVVDAHEEPAPEFVGESEPMETPEHHEPKQITGPDEIAAEGPPLDLTGAAENAAPLSEEELLGEMGGPMDATSPIVGEPATSHHDASQDTDHGTESSEILGTEEVVVEADEVLETGEVIEEHDGQAVEEAPPVVPETPPEPVEQDAPRRSLFRRTRRSG